MFLSALVYILCYITYAPCRITYKNISRLSSVFCKLLCSLQLQTAFILPVTQPSRLTALESPKLVRDELTEDSTVSDTEGVVIHAVVPLVVPPILLVSSTYSSKGQVIDLSVCSSLHSCNFRVEVIFINKEILTTISALSLSKSSFEAITSGQINFMTHRCGCQQC